MKRIISNTVELFRIIAAIPLGIIYGLFYCLIVSVIYLYTLINTHEDKSYKGYDK